MSTIIETQPETLADLLNRLGGVAPERVRMRPLPGTAVESDVIAVENRESRLYELVEGTLVEKAMGYVESLVASVLIERIRQFARQRRLGLVTGEGGMVRLFPGLVRIPDVAFVSRQRLAGGRVPSEPIPLLAPDLVVEVLSVSNTEREMQRKLGEYFDAGVRLVWLVDPRDRSVTVHTTVDQSVRLTSGDTLDGGAVLPGFQLPLAELFAELDEQGGT